jgi:hypothetical protein
MLRSQVIWRLASWRVAAMPVRAAGQVGDWRGAAGIEQLPGLAVAHAAHRRQVGVQVAARAQGRTSSTKPAASMASKALGDALVQPGAVGGSKEKSGNRQRALRLAIALDV